LLPILDSGHGGQTKDLNGDEVDGFDEGMDSIFRMILFAWFDEQQRSDLPCRF